MTPDYLLFSKGDETSGKEFCLAKRVEGDNPYAGLLAGGYSNLKTLVNVLVYGLDLDLRFKAEDVTTLDKPIPGLTPGVVIEPVDELTLQTFQALYSMECKHAPRQRQVWAIHDRSN